MAEFKLTIELGNAGMSSVADIAKELRRVADNICMRQEGCRKMQPDSGPIRDVNGNSVGRWEVTP